MARKSCGQVLLTLFRVVQFTLSLCALGSAIYIIYTLHNTASSAKEIEFALKNLDQNVDGVGILQDALVPVLKHLEEKSTRSIIICLAAAWSTGLILYLYFANRSAQHSTRDLTRNSRLVRILLSLVAICLWITAIVCSALLVVQYGVFTVSAGAETKVTVTAVREATKGLKLAASVAGNYDQTFGNILGILTNILTIGALSIFVLAASAICGMVELVSFFVACCVSGKSNGQPVGPQHGQYRGEGEKTPIQVGVTVTQV
ncbi:hypothetical protein K491DRAFT_713406 [Lophiostoma macrostomum CBS 122681]|uniref:Uncharacterized protein n=1 Tax=Lophiostoma macrostomum CBS 122681 TaxID=1314788 RepID=A0A6A6TFM3_9PLEO|nr:hypothetical protein K491DRAFT_713406 [Lophiostoma macrostomum CBS 122681]